MTTYEQLLDGDLSWALLEGSMHFEKGSAVHNALRKISKRLDDLGIAYAVAGGMAMFYHGYRRFTEDVDILVTEPDLRQIHEKLGGLGYLPPFERSKNLRDTELGVRIEFLVAGQYPGDGKPKPVAFPDPKEIQVTLDGIQFVSLPSLVELKLASGMTGIRRGRDLVDVEDLISTLKLPEEFSDKLDPYVRDRFREIWKIVQEHPEEPDEWPKTLDGDS